MTLLDVLVDFARTGRLGPLHSGMSLTEAGALLGAGSPHPAHRMYPSLSGYPYTWGDLRLYVSHGHGSGHGQVTGMSMRTEETLPGVDLPAFLLPDAGRCSPIVTLDQLTAALDNAGLHYDVDADSVPSQRFLRSDPHDVEASFSTDPSGRFHLLAMSSLIGLTVGEHESDRPPPPNPELYPDIAEAGSLAVALQAELGKNLTVKPETARGWRYLSAEVGNRKRYTRVHMAREVRLFELDSFLRGNGDTSMRSPELSEIAAAIHTRHSEAHR